MNTTTSSNDEFYATAIEAHLKQLSDTILQLKSEMHTLDGRIRPIEECLTSEYLEMWREYLVSKKEVAEVEGEGHS